MLPCFTKFSVHATLSSGRVWVVDSAIDKLRSSGFRGCASCFHIMGHVPWGVGGNDVGAVLQQVVEISSVFARGHHAVDQCIMAVNDGGRE